MGASAGENDRGRASRKGTPYAPTRRNQAFDMGIFYKLFPLPVIPVFYFLPWIVGLLGPQKHAY